jgi:hypothetical protein
MKGFRRRINDDNWFVRVRIAKGRDIGDTMSKLIEYVMTSTEEATTFLHP